MFGVCESVENEYLPSPASGLSEASRGCWQAESEVSRADDSVVRVYNSTTVCREYWLTCVGLRVSQIVGCQAFLVFGTSVAVVKMFKTRRCGTLLQPYAFPNVIRAWCSR